mmetsp:Transcript_31962/g.95719  ORF Transcript_31962/g.95719 Transcript_31962/m.95719 type:complete len:118 (-) Transcript_31962:1324-1677(-)
MCGRFQRKHPVEEPYHLITYPTLSHTDRLGQVPKSAEALKLLMPDDFTNESIEMRDSKPKCVFLHCLRKYIGLKARMPGVDAESGRDGTEDGFPKISSCEFRLMGIAAGGDDEWYAL